MAGVSLRDIPQSYRRSVAIATKQGCRLERSANGGVVLTTPDHGRIAVPGTNGNVPWPERFPHELKRHGVVLELPKGARLPGGELRARVVDMLQAADSPVSVKQIATHVERSEVQVRQILRLLRDRGQARNEGDGWRSTTAPTLAVVKRGRKSHRTGTEAHAELNEAKDVTAKLLERCAQMDIRLTVAEERVRALHAVQAAAEPDGFTRLLGKIGKALQELAE